MPVTRRGRVLATTYLLVVATVLLFVLATHTVFADSGGGANMSGAWLFIATMPWSLLLLVGTGPGRTAPFLALAVGLAVAAALNAMLLGWAGDRSADQ